MKSDKADVIVFCSMIGMLGATIVYALLIGC